MSNATPESEPPKVTLKHLEDKRSLDAFNCGVREVDRWARDKAHKFHANGRARVTIAVPEQGATPIGFYSLTHSIAETSKLLRREDRDVWDNAPIIYIGYIAVTRQRQRCGVGQIMLVHALQAAFSVHQIAPLYGVGLRALNDDAMRLYERVGFRKAPKEDGPTPLMILPIWTITDLFSKV